MKKTITINCIFILFLFAGLPGKLNAEQSLRIGIYDNPPKVFLDRKQQPAGLFADLLDHIAKKENLQIGYIYDSWNKKPHDLYNGRIGKLLLLGIRHRTSIIKL